MNKFSIVLLPLLLTMATYAVDPAKEPTPNIAPARPDQPEELGDVHWLRDLDQGLARAKADRKPILVLFSEVPGCSTCKNYGKNILSHPLIVEAIESKFVPVAIYNNVEGKDLEVLKSFNEAAWNNPVVRIIDTSRADLTPRVGDNYSITALCTAMITALEKQETPVPGYLTILRDESSAASIPTETVTFAMHCFWDGEAKLGGIKGVLGTKVGMYDGKEVVQVRYDPAVVSCVNVVRAARTVECADFVYVATEKQFMDARRGVGDERCAKRRVEITPSENDSLYRLNHSPYRAVPMTPLQGVKVNAALAAGEDPDQHLSRRQIRFRGLHSAHPDAKWPKVVGREDLAAALAEADAFAATLK